MSSASVPEILYEDNHVLVIVKPVNVPTQADISGDPDLLTLLKQDLKTRHNKPGNVFLGLVHRLDRPVGGVMVFAKTSKAASRLSDAVRTHRLEKTYTAVVGGAVNKPSGRLVHYLRKDNRSNTVYSVDKNSEGAKEAVLDYTVLAVQAGLTLVQVRLLTGRPHQIRVQWAAEGHPLYGDQRYGAGSAKPGQQIALWSTGLAFEHPTLKERLSFRSNPPGQHPWTLWPDLF